MKIERLGSSMFRIQTSKGFVLLIDPWISGNPTVPQEFKTRVHLDQIDALLVSHAHIDHVNGVMDIPEVRPEISVVCHMELGTLLKAKGIKNVHRMNFGGTIAIEGVQVTLVASSHSSSLGHGPERVWAGPAAGFVITLEDGYRIYYAGDTGLMSDMKFIIGEYFKPDLAILPVSGHVTMDPEQAAYAAGELIRPHKVIPFHYFPKPEEAPDPEGMVKFLELFPIGIPLVGDKGNEFKRVMQERYPQIETLVLELGECIQIETTRGT